MPITYKDFIKHASKVTKNDAIGDRSILRGIKHFSDGSAAVTDSHRLYLAKDVRNRTVEVVLSPTGKVIEGNYPDVKRIIPARDSYKQEMKVNVEDLLLASDTIKFFGTNRKPSILKIKEKEITYQSVEIGYSYKLDVDFGHSISLRAEYVADAMKLFKAAGCSEVTMRFNGSMYPLVFEGENVLALILPVREGK